MKRSVLLFLCLCIILCTGLCAGCSREPQETTPSDTTSAHDSETCLPPETVVPETILPETELSEAEYIPPPTHTTPPTYNNIREYAASPDAPDSLRELTGLPDEYAEVLVETGGLYCITYSNDNGAIAFYPCESEAVLENFMTAQLNTSGTYESLQANDLVSDVRKTDHSADGEILYECLYNTSIKTDLKLRYRECTVDGIRFILSSNFAQDGSLQFYYVFAFAGEASFACVGHAPFTEEELTALRSIPLN